MNPPRARLPEDFRHTLRDRARQMRRDMTPAEKKLRLHLRGDQFQGFRFRRQHVIGPYVADFFCKRVNLIVELDGDSHSDRTEHDVKRDTYLKERFFRVLRFANPDVFDHIDGVLSAIYDACESRVVLPSPPPSPRDGERE